MRLAVRTLGLVVVVISVMTADGCKNGSAGSSGLGTSVATHDSSNQHITLSASKIDLDARSTDPVEAQFPHMADRTIAVEVSFKNTMPKNSATGFVENFFVVDAKGKRYGAETEEAITEQNALVNDVTLDIDQSQSGWVPFDVPRSEKPAKVLYIDGGKVLATWTLP